MINTKISTKIYVKVYRDGVLFDELPVQKNLILAGQMSSLDQCGRVLHVGTGSAAPLFSDTSLVGLVATATGASWVNSTSVLNGNTYEKESSTVIDFGVGSVVGNLSELGLSGSASTGVDLDTRALFVDVLGDPTTITVTAQDQLVVTYFLTKHIAMSPVTSSVLLGGVTIDYTITPCISSFSDAGSEASYPSSIYLGGTFMYLTANDANRISVDPITFIPTSIDTGGDITQVGVSQLLLTATGNEIIHTLTMPVGSGNFQWVAATVSDGNNPAVNFVLFQIEFNGPNYITKLNTETVTFKIKEVVEQVI